MVPIKIVVVPADQIKLQEACEQAIVRSRHAYRCIRMGKWEEAMQWLADSTSAVRTVLKEEWGLKEKRAKEKL